MGKRNNCIKGFTLAELMAVIVILGIIMFIAIPTVDKTVKNAKMAAYNEQVNVIMAATSDWTLLNNKLLPSEEGNSIIIYLGQLKGAGLVDIDVKNPNTGNILSNNTSITITKKNDKYEYSMNLIDIDKAEDSNSPTLVIGGELVDYVEVNQESISYIIPSALAYTSTGLPIDSSYITHQIIKNDVEVANVDTSKLGSYKIKYNVTYEGKTGIYEKQVIVRDTTVPVITFTDNLLIESSKLGELNLNNGYTLIDNSGEILTPSIKSQISNIEGNYYAFYTG